MASISIHNAASITAEAYSAEDVHWVYLTWTEEPGGEFTITTFFDSAPGAQAFADLINGGNIKPREPRFSEVAA